MNNNHNSLFAIVLMAMLCTFQSVTAEDTTENPQSAPASEVPASETNEDADKLEVSITGTFIYDGAEKTPEVVVTLNGTELEKDIDYTLEFSNNKNAGTATVTVIPTESALFKQTDFPFIINPATVTVTGGTATKVYDGSSELTAATQVTVNTTGIVSGDDVTITVKEGAFAKKDAGETLLDVNEYQLAGDENTLKNYTLADDKPALEAIITQKEVNLVWSTPTSFDYNEEEKQVTATVDPTSLVEGDEVAVTEYTGNKAAEIGEYTATATALDNNNYKLPDDASISWEITSGLVVSGLDKALTYNGSEQKPEITVTYNDSKLTEGDDYTLVFANNINAGTAKVSVMPTESALFSKKDFPFTINPATVTVTGGSATKVYDGTSELTAATQVTVNTTGIVGGDDVTITVKEGAFAKKDAGETLLDVTEYQLEGDGDMLKNYTLADGKPALEAVITQKEVNLLWSTPTSFAYDEEEKQVTATVDPASLVEGDEVAVTEYTGNKATEIGEYTATATVLDNNNYKLPDDAFISWEITSGLVVSGLDKALTYNGSEQKPEIEVSFNDSKLTEGDDYTLVFANNINAGTAKVSVMPTESALFSKKDFTFTINPATVTITGGSASKVYDGTTDLTAATQVTVNTTGIVGEDEIAVTVKTGAFAQEVAGETLLDVSEYQLAGDENTIKNYTLADGKPALEAVITQKEVNLLWSTPTSFAYDEKEKEVTATVDPTSLVEGDEVAVSEYTGNKAVEIGEYTATATVLDNNNYKLPDNASITWEITSGLVVSGLDKALTYNGSELKPEIEVSFNDSKLTEGEDYTLEFSNNVNAGTATVSVKPTESALFSQKDLTFTINPATVTVTGGTATKVYDGTSDLTAATQVTVNTTGIVGEDEIAVTVKEGAFAQEVAGETLLDVSEYQLEGDGDMLKNYTLADDKPALEAIITQKEVNLLWSTPTSFAYDEEEKQVTATVDPTSLVEGDEVAVSKYTGNKAVEIGEYTATATVLDNNNYKLPDDASISWEITSGLVVSGLDKALTYNGSEQKPEITVTYNDSKLTEGEDYTLVFANNINAGTAKVSIMPTESALFSKKDFPFTINPATVTVTGGSASKVYDGTTDLTAATQVTVNTTGIVGEDEIAVTVKTGAFAQGVAGETLLDVTEYQLEGDGDMLKNYTLADDKPALEAVITQKEVNLLWSTPTSFDYNEEEKQVTATVDPTSLVEGDEVAVSEYTGNKAVEIGEYTATATVLDNNNYKLPENASITWEITSGLVVSGLDKALTYNGSEQKPEITVTYNDSKLTEGEDYTLEFSNNINAGTAKVSVMPTESALFSQKDFTFTINPATVSITGGSASKVYDGTTDLTAATQVTVNTTGIVGEDEITVTVKTGEFAQKDAGETLLDVSEYQLEGDENTIKNYTLADDKPALEAVIEQKTVVLVWSTPTSFVYDNEEKEVTATVDPASLVEGDEVAVSEYDGNKAKVIGKYIAYATSLNNGNYKIADKTSIIWEITSGLTVSGLDEVLTYNGNEQEPEIKVSFNEQKLEKDVDYTLAFSDNKNAGQAKVAILPIKNEETNTTLFEQKEFEFTIAPAVITVTGGTATKVYNGNENITTETSTDITFTGKIGDEDISVTVKSGSFAQKEAGETELNVTEYQLAGNEAKSGNYTLADEKPVLTAVIEQKEVALTWSTPTTFAYDGEEKEVTANIVASYIVEGDIVSVSAYTGNQSAEKGEHTATATALSNSNYKLPKNASKFWEITDGLEITGPTEALTYNGKEQQPEVTVKYNGVILVEKTDYTLKYSDNKNAGTAKVSVIPTSTSDFKQKDIEFTIHPAVITITGGTATKEYDGNNELTEGTITHFIVTGKIASDNISVVVKNGVFAQKDAGETELEITELLLNGSAGTVNNYVLASSTPKFKAEIKQKEVNLTWSTQTSFVYDGEEKVITANIDPSSIVEGDEVNISEYSGNQSADKGEYTAVAVALDNSNYKLPENASITWEIIGGLEILPIEELTYNGKEQQPEVTVLFNDKKLVESTDYTLEFTDNINAGTAKVSVVPTGTSPFSQKETTFTILPAVITVTGGNATKQYDGSHDFTTETAVDLAYTGNNGTDDISVIVKSGSFEQKDAGETVLDVTKYQLAGEAAATGNYILAENSPALSATIEQKEVALIWSTPTTFAYDGLEKEVTATIKASSVVEGDIVSVSAYTGNKSAEKGEHTATATALSNNNYKLPENASKDWEITDGLEITGPTDALTYNGEEQRPEITVKYNGVVLIEKTDYTLVYSNNKNAGTGKVSVVPTSTSEFKQKDIEFTINPAVITVTGGKATKVYDGTDEFTAETVADPVFTGKVGNDELTVSVRNGVFAQKEAGETELSATEMALVGDESVVSNYYLAVNKPKFDAVIEQKEVALVWSTPTTFEYDGEEKEVTATVDKSSIAEGDEVAVTEYSDNRSTEIREHFATADLLDNNNYKLPENAGIKWEIVSAVVPAEDYSIAIAVPTSGYVYDKLPKEPTVEVRIGDKLIDSSEYELSYTSNTRAGEAKVTVSAKIGANYTFEAKEATFEIAKAVINVATEITGKEYDGTVKAEVSLNTTGIIDGDDAVVNADAAYNDPNAGKDKPVKILYTIKGADKANYQLSATSLDTVAAITPKPLTLEWSEKKFTFDGTEKSVSVVAYKGVVGNEEVKVEEYSNQAKINAGSYTAKVEKLSSQNYTIGAGEETEWTISARKTDITIIATENNFTYNGKEQIPPIIVKDGNTEIPAENYSIRYENTINAGKATFTVEAKEGGNYIFKAKGGSYEIKPAAITFESESKTWVYDGKEHSAPKVTLTEGKLFGDDSFDFAVTGAITAVGKVDNEFTVTPKDGTQAGNYTITEKVGVLTVKANKISPITTDPITGEKTIVDPVTGETVPLTDPTMGYEVVVNPGNSEIVYDGKKKEPVVELFINGVKVPADEYNIVYKANTNAGTAQASVTDNKGGDYTFIGTTADFKIEPRELTLEWGETEFTYNGKRQQVSHTLQGVVDGDKVKAQVKGDTATNANSYKAIASGVDNKNYILRPDTVKWTILKADTEMPTLTPIAETEAGTKDGQIEGLQKGMEMKKEGEKKFAPVKDPAVKLAPGNYIVRIAGDKNHNASEEVLVTIQAGTVPYAIDSIIVPAFGYCPATDDNIRYVVSGENHPAAFRIIYSKEAEAAGFKNTGYIDITENGTLPVTIPNCDANTYKAKLQFRSVNNIESKTFDIELTVNLSSDYMIDIFEDVISAVNTEERFLEYQWYHNDILLEGETKPYYNQNKTLNGSYYMEVLTVDDRKLKTCRLNFEAVEADKLTAYPNPTHDYTTIELTNDNEEEHTLEVFSSAGERVKSDTFTGVKTEVNFVDLPQGVYIVKVDGLEVKVLKY